LKNPPLKNPIFLIGAARSGTTILGELLGKHEDVAYWIEPKYIWNYANREQENDIRTADEATDNIKVYIRKKFENYVTKHKATRFLEKTPSNCFRVEFIHEIFPNGKFLHLIRDGRDVALSARTKWTSKPDKTALLRRFLNLEIPLNDLSFYVGDFVRDVIGRQIFPEKAFLWGPKFDGIIEKKSKVSLLQICALQWKMSVEKALNDLSQLSSEQVHVVKFEDLLVNPSDKLTEVFEFLELSVQEKIIDSAEKQLNSSARFRWKNEELGTINEIEKDISDLLVQLSYKLSNEGKN
jgi:hypothetical protein